MSDFNEDITFYAFRYALGRMTYAVGDVTDYLIEHWHKYIIDTKAEVRFLKGEIKFNNLKRGLWLPFAIVIFRPMEEKF